MNNYNAYACVVESICPITETKTKSIFVLKFKADAEEFKNLYNKSNHDVNSVCVSVNPLNITQAQHLFLSLSEEKIVEYDVLMNINENHLMHLFV